MNRQEIMVNFAAILTTLRDMETEDKAKGAFFNLGVPESHIYLGLGMDLPKYELIRDLLLKSEVATRQHDCLRLTDKGRETAGKINAKIGK